MSRKLLKEELTVWRHSSRVGANEFKMDAELLFLSGWRGLLRRLHWAWRIATGRYNKVTSLTINHQVGGRP